MKQYFDTKTIVSVATGILAASVLTAVGKATGKKATEVAEKRKKKSLKVA